MGREILDGIHAVFKIEHSVVIYTASGTGAWEADLVNTLSPGSSTSSARIPRSTVTP
jgi:alanine-glyoxylate transaminase/serine-glyoxylate transaminase/serine-pyruvate transaminase